MVKEHIQMQKPHVKLDKIKNRNKLKKYSMIVNLFVHCNYKNTLISLSNIRGNLLKQWSTKSIKKKNKLKKNNPYNIQLIFNKINIYMKKLRVKKLILFYKGTGIAKYSILKNIDNKIKISFIFNKTSVSFNGCRKKKPKRR